jgi:alpha-mannosidase
MEAILSKSEQLEHQLGILKDRVFSPVPHEIELRFIKGDPDQRATMVNGPHSDWEKVTPETIWGAPQSYFWFAGTVVVPAHLEGQRLYLAVEAAFGRVMGRSDPQCLVRINNKIVQGADYNHREILLTDKAKAGERFDIMIEAGTIEDRRQLGFGVMLMVHDLALEALYYDAQVPLEVARHLPENDHRRDFILNQVNDALKLVDFRPGNPERFAQSLEAASKVLARIYEAADTELAPHITVTGHTHIDVAWLWRIRETRQKMARSMATALSLMDEYDDYHFMYNQGLLLDYLEEDYPELFNRIKAKQQKGQFEIEGALWLEPDANITGGESLVRHIVRGVRYHQDKFNVRPTLLWLPDTFGYSAAMPQLMALSGLTMFITHKMSWNDTNRMPHESFFWQGIDGTKAPAYFLTTQPMESKTIGTTYCPDLNPSNVMGTWRRYGQKSTNDELFLVYGFGDGGGGPTRKMLEHIRRMERGIPGCPRVSHGFMAPFFERLVARMEAEPECYPDWVGELYLEFHRGTFTSVAKVKRDNRRAEATLRELEALASLLWWRGAIDYPANELAELWDIALLNQFHDILPGSSIGEVFADSDKDFERFFAVADSLRARLTAAATGPDEWLVANPQGQARRGMVQFDSKVPLVVAGQPTQTLMQADGAQIEAAPLGDIPAAGVQRIIPDETEGCPPATSLSISPHHLENAHLRAEFNDQGRLTSLYDKAQGRQVLEKGKVGNRLQAFRDLPRQFDAWDIDSNFEDQVFEIDQLAEVEMVETGPYRAALRFKWIYESSTIVQIVSLEAGARLLAFDNHIVWHEHHTLLKAAFPLAVQTAEVRAEIQFGHVTRPTHQNTSWDQARFESPMHRFVDMSEPGFGVALLNDCKYGYDAKGTTLRLSLLRSPTYPWPEADQGEHHFRYGLYVHDGWANSDVPTIAEQFNAPLIAQKGGAGASPLDLSALFTLDNAAISVEAIKRSEDGQDLILRLNERMGAAQSTHLEFSDQKGQVVLTDLLEEESQALGAINKRLKLDFRPFEIKTLRLSRASMEES